MVDRPRLLACAVLWALVGPLAGSWTAAALWLTVSQAVALLGLGLAGLACSLGRQRLKRPLITRVWLLLGFPLLMANLSLREPGPEQVSLSWLGWAVAPLLAAALYRWLGWLVKAARRRLNLADLGLLVASALAYALQG